MLIRSLKAPAGSFLRVCSSKKSMTSNLTLRKATSKKRLNSWQAWKYFEISGLVRPRVPQHDALLGKNRWPAPAKNPFTTRVRSVDVSWTHLTNRPRDSLKGQLH